MFTINNTNELIHGLLILGRYTERYNVSESVQNMGDNVAIHINCNIDSLDSDHEELESLGWWHEQFMGEYDIWYYP